MGDRIPGLGHLLNGQPELGERLQRALLLKGEIPQFLEQRIGVSITVDDLTRAEYDYLRRTTRFVSGLTAGAVAAQLSQVVLGFPAGATLRHLLAVDQLIISNFGAAAMSCGFGVAALAAVVPTVQGLAADDRLWTTGGGGTPSVAMLGNGANAASPLSVQAGAVVLPGNSSIIVPCNFLMTNQLFGVARLGVYVVGNTVNQAVGATFCWRERSLLSSEL
jgi:hypothetical protein